MTIRTPLRDLLTLSNGRARLQPSKPGEVVLETYGGEGASFFVKAIPTAAKCG